MRRLLEILAAMAALAALPVSGSAATSSDPAVSPNQTASNSATTTQSADADARTGPTICVKCSDTSVTSSAEAGAINVADTSQTIDQTQTVSGSAATSSDPAVSPNQTASNSATTTQSADADARTGPTICVKCSDTSVTSSAEAGAINVADTSQTIDQTQTVSGSAATSSDPAVSPNQTASNSATTTQSADADARTGPTICVKCSDTSVTSSAEAGAINVADTSQTIDQTQTVSGSAATSSDPAVSPNQTASNSATTTQSADADARTGPTICVKCSDTSVTSSAEAGAINVADTSQTIDQTQTVEPDL